MIGQPASSETYFDKTTSFLGNATGNFISQSNLYQAIADDFSVSQKHCSDLVDTTFEDNDKFKDIFPNKLPTSRESLYSFAVLQEWEGYVVSISNDTFTARLLDVTKDSSIEDEEADFPIDDLDDADRARICLGAIFRWAIGYRRSPGGTKDRYSRIVLRNLPAWTKKELEKNRRDSAIWARELNEDERISSKFGSN